MFFAFAHLSGSFSFSTKAAQVRLVTASRAIFHVSPPIAVFSLTSVSHLLEFESPHLAPAVARFVPLPLRSRCTTRSAFPNCAFAGRHSRAPRSRWLLRSAFAALRLRPRFALCAPLRYRIGGLGVPRSFGRSGNLPQPLRPPASLPRGSFLCRFSGRPPAACLAGAKSCWRPPLCLSSPSASPAPPAPPARGLVGLAGALAFGLRSGRLFAPLSLRFVPSSLASASVAPPVRLFNQSFVNCFDVSHF